jgi:hypothetical protein
MDGHMTETHEREPCYLFFLHCRWNMPVSF